MVLILEHFSRTVRQRVILGLAYRPRGSALLPRTARERYAYYYVVERARQGGEALRLHCTCRGPYSGAFYPCSRGPDTTKLGPRDGFRVRGPRETPEVIPGPGFALCALSV